MISNTIIYNNCHNLKLFSRQRSDFLIVNFAYADFIFSLSLLKILKIRNFELFFGPWYPNFTVFPQRHDRNLYLCVVLFMHSQF